MSDVASSLYSPNTGEVFDTFNPVSSGEIADALDAASGHLPALASRDRRVEALDAAIVGLDSVQSELAETIVVELGKTAQEAAVEIAYARSFLTWSRGAVDAYPFETSVAAGRFVREVPIGVALAIAPYNDPCAGLTRKIGPALAAGCPVLVKPSPLAAVTGRVLARGFRNAGLAGAVGFLETEDNEAIGRLIDAPVVAVVSFTGSTAGGLAVARRANAALKPMVAELGGHNPMVIFADADLHRALDDLIGRKFRAAGQACSAVNRLFVETAVFDDVLDRLRVRLAMLRTGPSTDEGISYGPLRTRAAAERRGCAVDDDGAVLQSGQLAVPSTGPFLFEATLVEVDGQSPFDRQETFGPLFSICRFSDRQRLFAQLREEQHPLAAYFYTSEPESLLPQLAALRFGSLGLNTTAIQGADVPTGGQRLAGMGREGGFWGLKHFLQPINHSIRGAT